MSNEAESTCVGRGTLHITFSHPVNNPRLHLGGIGTSTAVIGTGYAQGSWHAVYVLTGSSTPVTLTEIAGNASFVTNTVSEGSNIFPRVTNESLITTITSSCPNANAAACGTVVVNGSNITSLTFRIDMRFRLVNNSLWPDDNNDSNFDGHTLSVSMEPPRIRVDKISNGGTGTFSFSGTNGLVPHTVTTTTVGTAASGQAHVLVSANFATTVSEGAPPQGYMLSSIGCTGMGPGGTATPTINGSAGGSVLLNAAATIGTQLIVCTFVNNFTTNLRLTKTNAVPFDINNPSDSTTDTVVSGTQATYTLVVSNLGPGVSTNAVLKEVSQQGLDCPASSPVSCTVVGDATCPTAGLTMGGLQSGLILPRIGPSTSTPPANYLQLSYQCMVL